jgi:hypothetical protein
MQIEHELAFAVILSAFNWKSRRKDFQLQFPISAIAFLYRYYPVASGSCQQSRAIFPTISKCV